MSRAQAEALVYSLLSCFTQHGYSILQVTQAIRTQYSQFAVSEAETLPYRRVLGQGKESFSAALLWNSACEIQADVKCWWPASPREILQPLTGIWGNSKLYLLGHTYQIIGYSCSKTLYLLLFKPYFTLRDFFLPCHILFPFFPHELLIEVSKVLLMFYPGQLSSDV